MRLNSLHVENFRGVQKATLENLGDVVVIAGPNGCGKSCLLDAIRLLKSTYGGYQPNEWQQWFSEFNINIGRSKNSWLPLLQNKEKPLEIRASVSLSEYEKTYLIENSEELLKEHIWRTITYSAEGHNHSRNVASLAANLRTHEPDVQKKYNALLKPFLKELQAEKIEGVVRLEPNGRAFTEESALLELIFSLYEPEHIGVVDFHSANRTFSREGVGGINLNIENSEDHRKSHALYNSSNKYANLKSQMAGTYVRGLLAQKYNQNTGDADSFTDTLTETLKDLFSTFFPGKQFLGPTPAKEGSLEFPVRLSSGAIHDINELSSGEKEVLYGYLRLRNATPRNSVILIDEPELHLNPRLVSGLARFYHQHLSKPYGNQLWLVTHSDVLIRESVGNSAFKVFHMQPMSALVENQLSEVRVSADVERVVIDLVGDLAAYRPGAKVVIFEGGGDQKFDVRMVSRLFPEFDAAVNMVSAGDSGKVTQLYDLLNTVSDKAKISARFYAVVDRDWEDGPQDKLLPTRVFKWNVFHIENYLLEAEFLREVLIDLNKIDANTAISEIDANLLECAANSLHDLARHKLAAHSNKLLVSAIKTSFDPKSQDYGLATSSAVAASVQRILNLTRSELTVENLVALSEGIQSGAKLALKDGTWKHLFRGREVLKRFFELRAPGVGYEVLRDLTLAKMRDRGFRPPGMTEIIQHILNDQ